MSLANLMWYVSRKQFRICKICLWNVSKFKISSKNLSFGSTTKIHKLCYLGFKYRNLNNTLDSIGSFGHFFGLFFGCFGRHFLSFDSLSSAIFKPQFVFGFISFLFLPCLFFPFLQQIYDKYLSLWTERNHMKDNF